MIKTSLNLKGPCIVSEVCFIILPGGILGDSALPGTPKPLKKFCKSLSWIEDVELPVVDVDPDVADDLLSNGWKKKFRFQLQSSQNKIIAKKTIVGQE